MGVINDEDGDLLTIRELQDALGVSHQTIYRWRKRGLLPALKEGNVVRFSDKDIATLLDRLREDRGFFRRRWGPVWVVREPGGQPVYATVSDEQESAWGRCPEISTLRGTAGYRAEKMWLVELSGDAF